MTSQRQDHGGAYGDGGGGGSTRSSAASNGTNAADGSLPSPSPSPFVPTMEPAPSTPYTARHLALDLAPIALWVLMYSWMYVRGLCVSPLLILLMQLGGASYVFFVLLKKEMQPPHWPGARPVADDKTTVSPPVTPDSAPIIAPPSLPTPPLQKKKKHLKYFDLIAAQSVNPFLHPAWKITSQLERLRISVMAVTLVPFRVVACAVVLLLTAGVLQLALLGLSPKDAVSKPLSRRRKALLSFLVRLAARSLVTLGLGYVRGVSVFEHNLGARETDPSVAPIIVANHTSFVDPLLLFGSLFASAVGAIDNLRAPVIGTICAAIQTITVDRRDEQSRHKVVEEIKRRATWARLSDAEKIARHGPGAEKLVWPPVLLFPEGTCENGSALIGFKQGAFVAKQPVQPVLVTYPSYPNNRFHPAWVSAGPNVLILLLRLLSEPLNYANIRFLPVMAPLECEANPEVDCAVFARRVRRRMAEEMQVPVTEHTYEDVVLQESALNVGRKKTKQHKKATLAVGDPSVERQLSTAASTATASPVGPPSTPATAMPLLTSLVEVATLQRIFNVDLAQVQSHLERFQRMDVRRQGRVHYDEFLRFFDIDPVRDAEEGTQSSMRQLFALLDNDDSGSLDFREFLVGLALLADAEREPSASATSSNSDTKDGGKNNNNSNGPKRRGSIEPELEHKLLADAAARHEATLRLAFDMFSTTVVVHDEASGEAKEEEIVRVNDLRRIFRRAFPDAADSAVEHVFAQAEAKAAQAHPELVCKASPRVAAAQGNESAVMHAHATQTPGGGPGAVGFTFEEFKEFCHEHPECVGKFKATLLQPVAAVTNK